MRIYMYTKMTFITSPNDWRCANVVVVVVVVVVVHDNIEPR